MSDLHPTPWTVNTDQVSIQDAAGRWVFTVSLGAQDPEALAERIVTAINETTT